MTKHPRYQDYVIRDGKLVGEFEQMYRDFDDPWEQSTSEKFASEKAVTLNLLSMLKAQQGIRRVTELGCGFGDFTARIAALGLDATGIDISETAITKAKARHPAVDFVATNIADRARLKALAPDAIVMAEITWYVLEELPGFLDFFRRELPNTYLIHLLTTYDPGVQKYGREWFSTLDEIKAYFGFQYLEWGAVQHPGGTRTWFLGKP